MKTDVNGGTVGLLALDALNVHDVLATVALQHLAGLLALVVAARHLLFHTNISSFKIS